jgi:hypothetical protein
MAISLISGIQSHQDRRLRFAGHESNPSQQNESAKKQLAKMSMSLEQLGYPSKFD